MSALIVSISRDPRGVYIGHDARLNLYWYSDKHNVWVYLDPNNFGTEVE